MINSKLSRIPMLVTKCDKDRYEKTWAEAEESFAEELSQRDAMIKALLLGFTEEGGLLTGHFYEDIDLLAEWIKLNATFVKRKNPLPKEFWVSDEEEWVTSFDYITLNACFALAMYIAVQIEEITGGVYALALYKESPRSIDYHSPYIRIIKNKVHFQPVGGVVNSLLAAVRDPGFESLGIRLKRTLSNLPEEYRLRFDS